MKKLALEVTGVGAILMSLGVLVGALLNERLHEKQKPYSDMPSYQAGYINGRLMPVAESNRLALLSMAWLESSNSWKWFTNK
jgi:hypothetical protein